MQDPVRPLIWDAPQRLAHWLMLLCFVGAWLTGERDGARLWHLSFGICLAGLAAWRVLWGFVGSRHARFVAFLRGPSAVVGHLAALAKGRAMPVVGHNPAGAWAVVALLACALLVPTSGWLALVGGEIAEELHEGLAKAWLLLVGVHVAGVLLTSLLQRVNLVRSMVDGRQPGPADAALPSARWGWALLLLALVGALWTWQALQAPNGQAFGQAEIRQWVERDNDVERRGHHDGARDDDD